MCTSSEQKMRDPVHEGQIAPPQSAKGVRSPALLVGLFSLVVVSATLVAHWPVLSAQAKSFDDEEAIVHNHLIQNPSWKSVGRFFSEVTLSSVVRGYYRPLTLTSLMLDWAMGGRPDDFRVFHRTSLALHIGSTLLLILLCYQIFHKPLIAALVGLLFGVHPLTVEPIAWVMERKTLLAAFFAFACLCSYVRYTQKHRTQWLAIAMILYLLSLFAKPTGTPLPVIMLLMDVWPLNRFSRRVILEKIPFFLLSLVFAILCMVCEQKVNPLSLPAKLSLLHLPLRLCWLITFYPCKILLPINLSSVYVLPTPLALTNGWALLGMLGAIFLAVALVVSRRWTPAFLTTAGMFYVGLAPTMGFVGYSWVAASDKYAYLPAVGPALALSWLLQHVGQSASDTTARIRQLSVIIAIVAVASLLGIGTRKYLAHWQTTDELSTYQIRLAPQSPEALYSHGKILQDKGDLAGAIQEYSKAIDLKPYYPDAYNNRGNAYAGLGDLKHALADYDKAIQYRSDYAEAYNNRGSTYSDIQDFERAMDDYSKAIALNPNYAEAYTNRSAAFLAIQAPDRAITDATKAIELKPSLVKAYNNRGNAYIALGDYQRAVVDYQNALAHKPDYAEAYHNLAVSYFFLKQYDMAWENIRKFRQLGGTPNPAFIHDLANKSGKNE